MWAKARDEGYFIPLPRVRRRYEGDSVGLGMLEVFFGVTVGVVLVAVAIIWWRLERNAFIIKHSLESSSTTLKHSMDRASDFDMPTLEDFREEMQDLIQDTLGAMKTPQMGDHIGGALAAGFQQWMQIKMHKEMQSIQETANLITESPIGAVVDEMLP